jgi:hypothetical protein
MKIKFNKVTPYSKAIALTLFVAWPFLFFWFGIIYGQTIQHTADILAGLKEETAVTVSQTTQVLRYSPPAPTSSMPVVSGSCFANSIAAPYRPDAWRCTVGNAIQDPCFQIGTGSSLLCGVDPEDAAASSTFVLALSEALPVAQTPPNPPPDWSWRVKLQDGTICTPFTGTFPFAADGRVAKYGCAARSPGDNRMIFGDLNASPTMWTALVGSFAKTDVYPPPIGSSSQAPIAVVWQ